ncbi:MAG: L,D-transpeptidase/peptidoglycan binding protein [Actinomycetota bacterium]|nr:L,D-transpeptidase/peptidoglycan binding protein [Actinomycetota bacterium]
MGRKTLISLVSVVCLMIVVAAGVYWFDSINKETISEGVTIGDVDVGGLEAEAAASQVRTNLVVPLEKTLKVTYGDEDFELTEKEAGIRTDIDAMVDEALAVSQEGGLPGRTWRAITGEEVDHEISPEIAYDEDEVEHFINHIGNVLDRDPVDASIDPSGGSLKPVAAQAGLKVDPDRLRRQVENALYDPTERKLRAEVDEVKPEVTTSQVAEKYPTYVVVNRANFTLSMYRNLKLEKEYAVAIGAQGFETPVGEYAIESKQVDPVWSVPNSAWAGSLAGQVIPPGPSNPLKARWMGIYNGAGIHGTEDVGSLGSAASHGCVRMAVPDVIDLYDRVDVGTPIYIG